MCKENLLLLPQNEGTWFFTGEADDSFLFDLVVLLRSFNEAAKLGIDFREEIPKFQEIDYLTVIRQARIENYESFRLKNAT